MAWLRIDDGFAQHPKIAALTDRELRVWLRLLCWLARYSTDDRPIGQAFDPRAATGEVAGLTPKVLARFVELILVEPSDHADGLLAVHDWQDYNAPRQAKTNAERQAAWRDRQRGRDGSRNDGSNDDVTSGETDSRAGAGRRARSRPQSVIPVSQSRDAADEPGTDDRGAAVLVGDEGFRHAGWAAWQVAQAAADRARASAWLQAARVSGARSPGAWAWSGFQRGGWPDAVEPRGSVPGLNRSGGEPDPSSFVEPCLGCDVPTLGSELVGGRCPACVAAAVAS